MLELKKITKIYKTNDFKQTALDEIDINFRNSEFAAILGPSGSGKTTLLNIIGGLDHYTTGDLIINNTSTKKYNDRDWDSYRNYCIGFIFQSYNLISHQSILANVELALTLSGVSKKERRKRAIESLETVGLKNHMNKKPNQLSGGQMQRVAIARALINNPDILLADEPTGALDSETSVQVLDILQKVAKDKLVIMVTHNAELAEKYATRIIKIKDGHLIEDTNPYDDKDTIKNDKEIIKKKTSMSLMTALSLSLNNLMTKKGRTILTAIAGSIGIIGIALILSLSTGVQDYINKVQREALTSYPLSIESTNIDIAQMMGKNNIMNKEEITCKENNICTIDNISNSIEIQTSLLTSTNNLTNFKKYLDNNGDNINDYVTDIKYSYDVDLQIYSKDFTNGIVKINPNTLSLTGKESLVNNQIRMTMINTSSNVFSELIENDALLNSEYDVLSGRLPKSYNEMVLVVDKNNQLPLSVMYSLDIENRQELSELINNDNTDDIKLDSINYDYDKIIGTTYKLVLSSDYYTKENNTWVNKTDDLDYMKNLITNGVDVSIVGVVKINSNSEDVPSGFVGYTHDLIEFVINQTNEKDIVKEQLDNKYINVLTGKSFDNFTTTYENNLKILGIANLDNPSSIDIYSKDFESKEQVEEVIKKYNQIQEDNGNEENIIEYTDMIGILLSSVTSIVNVVSYILIAFVAVSLVVSSIMIAIITYISVLERTKEIGILRAIGASKKDVSRVFKAETIIEGFVAGTFGVVIAYLLTLPINSIINSMYGIENIAKLPLNASIILVLISVILTVIAGLIPARMASKKDPVESLRSE